MAATVGGIPDERLSVGVRGGSDTVRIAACHERRPHLQNRCRQSAAQLRGRSQTLAN